MFSNGAAMWDDVRLQQPSWEGNIDTAAAAIVAGRRKKYEKKIKTLGKDEILWEDKIRKKKRTKKSFDGR